MSVTEGGSVAFDYNIPDVGVDPIRVHSEYTSQEILSLWGDPVDGFFSVVNDVFGKQPQLIRDASGNIIQVDPSTLSDTDAVNLANALDKIMAVAKDGLVINGKTYYLTFQMATSLEKILGTLNAVGFDKSLKTLDWNVVGGALTSTPVGPPVSYAGNVSALKLWVDLDDVGLRNIIIDAGQAVANARSLQAMVELEYVKVGNDLIGYNMEQLEKALTATKSSLKALERAQRLKNQLNPESMKAKASYRTQIFLKHQGSNASEGKFWLGVLGPPGIPGPGSPLFAGFGERDVIDYLGRTVDNTHASGAAFCNLTVTGGDFQRFFENRLARIFDTIINATVDDEANISEFSQIRSDLESALTDLEAAGVNRNEEGTIANKIDQVLNEMNAAAGDDTEKMKNWILDFYDDSTDVMKSGEYQRNLTGAITAAESLNDQQKEDLRRYMFVFEQFYKSAAAMLQAMDRMIAKMAQNIAR